MAKLSTPYHNCEQPFAPSDNGVTAHCQFAAYRLYGGRWLCKTHRRLAEARAKRLAAEATRQPGATN